MDNLLISLDFTIPSALKYYLLETIHPGNFASLPLNFAGISDLLPAA